MAQLLSDRSLRCWFSHFDDDDDANSNDTSNDKRSQHLPNASGLPGTFLNAMMCDFI